MGCWMGLSRRSDNLEPCDRMRTPKGRAREVVRRFGGICVMPLCVWLWAGAAPVRAVAQAGPASAQPGLGTPEQGKAERPRESGHERFAWGRGLLEPSEADRLPLQPPGDSLPAFLTNRALGYRGTESPESSGCLGSP